MRGMRGMREIGVMRGMKGMIEEKRIRGMRNCKLKVYIDYELKVGQVITSFDIQGQERVRLVTLAFGDYALIW
ncbi:hypothetical protein CR513_22556, partial [Mucuna pruriens]